MAMMNSFYLMVVVSCVGCAANLGGNGEGGTDTHDYPCDDVSHYSDVMYRNETRLNCTTEFEKICEDKKKQISKEVTDITCEVLLYTNCSMDMANKTFREVRPVPKTYPIWVCDTEEIIVMHEKWMPNCTTVVKQNCDTIWTIDVNGNQIWDGTKNCKPVEWKECQLVRVKMPHNTTKVTCYPGANKQLPYNDIILVNKTMMTSDMTCEVHDDVSCKTFKTTKWGEIEYWECFQKPTEKCHNETVLVPYQDYIHKKKCILNEKPLSPMIHDPPHTFPHPNHEHPHADPDTPHPDHHESDHPEVEEPKGEEPEDEASGDDERAGRDLEDNNLPIHPNLRGIKLNEKTRRGKALIPQLNRRASFSSVISLEDNQARIPRNIAKEK